MRGSTGGTGEGFKTRKSEAPRTPWDDPGRSPLPTEDVGGPWVMLSIWRSWLARAVSAMRKWPTAPSTSTDVVGIEKALAQACQGWSRPNPSYPGP